MRFSKSFLYKSVDFIQNNLTVFKSSIFLPLLSRCLKSYTRLNSPWIQNSHNFSVSLIPSFSVSSHLTKILVVYNGAAGASNTLPCVFPSTSSLITSNSHGSLSICVSCIPESGFQPSSAPAIMVFSC